MRGIVEITGTTIEQRLGLAAPGRNTRLVATTADSAALVRLGGVDVSVRGEGNDRSFRVASFKAMSVNGAPVVDGVLRAEGASIALETTEGRVRLGNPPAEFRRMLGARVWVSGSLDNGPNSYGVIVPPRT